MTADPLSDIIDLVDAQCLMTGGISASGAWAVRFPPPQAVKFIAVIDGGCWLSMDLLPEPRWLATGDVILVNGPHAFSIASDPSLEPSGAVALFANTADGFAQLGDIQEFGMLGGHIALDAAHGHLLLDVLPPLVHVRGAAPEAVTLRILLGQLVGEVRADRAGAKLTARMLAQLMFVQVLRAHLTSSQTLSRGWLQALGDERIAPALRLLHGEPGRAWTLSELAKAVGMSRTVFAERFRDAAGMAPLTYLLGLRMALAARDLRDRDASVAAIGLALGYSSESAFSNAFKREMGMPPRRYRSAARNSAA